MPTQVGNQVLEFALQSPHVLPASRLSVLCLPLVYGAPHVWVGGRSVDAPAPGAESSLEGVEDRGEDRRSDIIPLAERGRLRVWLVAGTALSPV